jgi:hypothetical protein
MLKRPIWRRVEKVNYAAFVVGITLDGLPGQGSLAMAFAQSLPFLTPSVASVAMLVNSGSRREAIQKRRCNYGKVNHGTELRARSSHSRTAGITVIRRALRGWDHFL